MYIYVVSERKKELIGGISKQQQQYETSSITLFSWDFHPIFSWMLSLISKR